MFLNAIFDVKTTTVSHLSFQLFVIERMIFGTLSDIPEIPILLCSSKPIYRQGFNPRVDSTG